MSNVRNVAVFVGSLRAGSYSRKIAHALAELARPALSMGIVEIGDLPFYDEDVEAEPPAAWTTLRDRIRAAEAVLFVTPEYNRSVPAVLKNAIDVGSRPFGKSAWSGKPGAVVSTSIGLLGGFGANQHLRQSLVAVDVAAMQRPEVYVGRTSTLFDAEGRLTDERVTKTLAAFAHAFAGWIERMAPRP